MYINNKINDLTLRRLLLCFSINTIYFYCLSRCSATGGGILVRFTRILLPVMRRVYLLSGGYTSIAPDDTLKYQKCLSLIKCKSWKQTIFFKVWYFISSFRKRREKTKQKWKKSDNFYAKQIFEEINFIFLV